MPVCSRADASNRLSCRKERERGADDLVAVSNLEGLQSKDEGVGAICDADRVRDSEECRGLVLERLDHTGGGADTGRST